MNNHKPKVIIGDKEVYNFNEQGDICINKYILDYLGIKEIKIFVDKDGGVSLELTANNEY